MHNPDRIDLIVGNNLRTMRKASGITQQDLGRAIGVSFQQVQKYEIAHNRISASRLWRAAQALGVPVNFFFREHGVPSVRATDGRQDCPYNGQLEVRKYKEVNRDGL